MKVVLKAFENMKNLKNFTFVVCYTQSHFVPDLNQFHEFVAATQDIGNAKFEDGL